MEPAHQLRSFGFIDNKADADVGRLGNQIDRCLLDCPENEGIHPGLLEHASPDHRDRGYVPQHLDLRKDGQGTADGAEILVTVDGERGTAVGGGYQIDGYCVASQDTEDPSQKAVCQRRGESPDADECHVRLVCDRREGPRRARVGVDQGSRSLGCERVLDA